MDIDIEEHTDAFAIRDLWRPSRFALPDLQSNATLFPELELDSESSQPDAFCDSPNATKSTT